MSPLATSQDRHTKGEGKTSEDIAFFLQGRGERYGCWREHCVNFPGLGALEGALEVEAGAEGSVDPSASWGAQHLHFQAPLAAP